MREIRTYGSTGRGSETGHGDDYTGTKPETADTDKSEPTGTAPTLDPTILSLGRRPDMLQTTGKLGSWCGERGYLEGAS